MNEHPMMQCGHAANAQTGDGDPSCVICSPKPESRIMADHPDLTDRESRCSCGQIKPSSVDLAFFEYRGPGSPQSVNTCKHCSYYKIAHDRKQNGKNLPNVCDDFVPHGPFEYDLHYCGHSGWD